MYLLQSTWQSYLHAVPHVRAMDLQSTSFFIYGHLSTMSRFLFPLQPPFFSPTYHSVHHLFFPMSSIPLIPPGLDIYESKAPQCYAAAIATYLFAVIAVALRFWARRLMKAEIWVDDWTAAAALVLATGSFIGTIVCKNAKEFCQ